LKILITGGKTATAFKLLKAFDGHEVILADYGDVPSISSLDYQFLSLGEANLDTVAHHLLSTCLDNEIDALLPLHQFAVEPLIKAGILFKEFNVDLIIPSLLQLEMYGPNLLVEKKDWTIFLNGALIYATEAKEMLLNLGRKEELSGAFYCTNDQGNLKLSLIAI
jgi:hypothetical protein